MIFLLPIKVKQCMVQFYLLLIIVFTRSRQDLFIIYLFKMNNFSYYSCAERHELQFGLGVSSFYFIDLLIDFFLCVSRFCTQIDACIY